MRRPSSAGLSIVVAVLLCVVAIGAAVFSAIQVFKDPNAASSQIWFYDLNTKELFAGPSDAVPPIEAPSGDLQGGKPGEAAGVGAVVLSIDGKDKIAYLYSYDPETKKHMETMRDGDTENEGPGMPPNQWVRAADGGKWYSEMSEEGSKLMQDSLTGIGDNVKFSQPR